MFTRETRIRIEIAYEQRLWGLRQKEEENEPAGRRRCRGWSRRMCSKKSGMRRATRMNRLNISPHSLYHSFRLCSNNWIIFWRRSLRHFCTLHGNGLRSCNHSISRWGNAQFLRHGRCLNAEPLFCFLLLRDSKKAPLVLKLRYLYTRETQNFRFFQNNNNNNLKS